MKYNKPFFEITAGHGGAIAMLMVPDNMASDIVSWGESHINDEEVTAGGRDGSPHITLQNGIMCEDSSELENLFSDLSPINVKLGPLSIFKMDDKDYDVVYIPVESEQLHNINTGVSDLLEVNSKFDEYRPHITLAYLKKGAGARFEGLKDFEGKELVLDNMVIDGSDIEAKHVPLKGTGSDILEGGAADGMSYGDFDKKDLDSGANHELEHTNSIEIAREIAMDHLSEDPNYYKKLEKIESAIDNREKLRRSQEL